MGVNNSSLTPLNCILKNWDRFDPQGLKKTHLVFLCDTAWPRYPLEDGERWPVGGSLKYNTVLQLDRFCKEQGKWVEVAYVLPFFSLQNMPDLCPKGIDLGIKPSAPSCPPTLLPCPGLQAELTESQKTPLRTAALVSVKTQTEIQTALVSVKIKLRFKLLWSQWKSKLRFKPLWSQWKPKLRFKVPMWRSKQPPSQHNLRLLWFQ